MGEAKTTNHDKTHKHESHTGHVDGCSADVWEKKPADYTTDDIACREGDVHVEGLDLGEACCFEEGHGIAENCIATKNLGCPYDAVLGNVSLTPSPVKQGT